MPRDRTVAENLTADGLLSYTWNGESQLASTAGVTYTYDGDGKRVKKSNGKLYWYGMAGEALTETELGGDLRITADRTRA